MLGDWAQRVAGAGVGGGLGLLSGNPAIALAGAAAGLGVKDVATVAGNRVTRKVAEKSVSARATADAIEKAELARKRKGLPSLLEPYVLPYQFQHNP